MKGKILLWIIAILLLSSSVFAIQDITRYGTLYNPNSFSNPNLAFDHNDSTYANKTNPATFSDNYYLGKTFTSNVPVGYIKYKLKFDYVGSTIQTSDNNAYIQTYDGSTWSNAVTLGASLAWNQDYTFDSTYYFPTGDQQIKGVRIFFNVNAKNNYNLTVNTLQFGSIYDEYHMLNITSGWYLNDTLYNETDSIIDSWGINDGTGYGKKFYHGVNNGSTVNDTNPVNGTKFGSYRDFDGASSVEIDDVGMLYNGDITLMFWANADEAMTATNNRVLDKSEGTTGQNGFYLLYNAGTDQYAFSINGSASLSINVAPSSYHHISYVINGSRYVKGYKDGILSNEGQFTKNTSQIKTTNNLFIGSRLNTDRFFTGNLDEIKIFNKILSQAEIQEEMNANAVANQDGIVAYYSFNNDNGTTVYDTNHLTTGYKQSVYTEDEPVFSWDTAISFDGVDDRVSLSQIDTINYSKTFTVSGWFKSVGTKDQQTIFSQSTDANNRFTIQLRSSGTSVRASWTKNSVQTAIASSTSLALNEYHFFSYIYNSSDNSGILYVDGIVQSGSLSPSSSGVVATTIGAVGNPTYFFNGSIANVRIYNRSLTEDEIHWLYNSYEFATDVLLSDYVVNNNASLRVDGYNYSIDSNELRINTYNESYNLSLYFNNTLQVIYPYTSYLSYDILNLSSIDLNTVTFLDQNTTLGIANASVIIEYPNGNEITRTTNSTGSIQFPTYNAFELQNGTYSITFEDNQGYITPITFTKTVSEAQLPFEETYNISRTTININIYYRSSFLYFTELADIYFLGVGNFSTTTGKYNFTNISLSDGLYTIQVLSDNYFTEQKQITYDGQEDISVDFYLLENNATSSGSLTVTVTDGAQIRQSEARVSLEEYSSDDLSFIGISECYTDSQGECNFLIEINSKSYKISASKTISGVLRTGSTGDEPVIFREEIAGGTPITFEPRQVTIQLSTTTPYNYSALYYLRYNIDENFNEATNVSTISTQFYTTDGSAVTICEEFYEVSNTQKTSLIEYCITSSSGTLTPTTPFLINRSKTVLVEVYLDDNGAKYVLDSYIYPSITSFETYLKNNALVAPVIIILWIILISLGLYLGNAPLIGIGAIVLSVIELSIFPSYLTLAGTVLKILIGISVIYIGRKKEDFN